MITKTQRSIRLFLGGVSAVKKIPSEVGSGLIGVESYHDRGGYWSPLWGQGGAHLSWNHGDLEGDRLARILKKNFKQMEHTGVFKVHREGQQGHSWEPGRGWQGRRSEWPTLQSTVGHVAFMLMVSVRPISATSLRQRGKPEHFSLQMVFDTLASLTEALWSLPVLKILLLAGNPSSDTYLLWSDFPGLLTIVRRHRSPVEATVSCLKSTSFESTYLERVISDKNLTLFQHKT